MKRLLLCFVLEENSVEGRQQLHYNNQHNPNRDCGPLFWVTTTTLQQPTNILYSARIIIIIIIIIIIVVDNVLLIPLVSILSHFKIIYHKLSQHPEPGQPSRPSLSDNPFHSHTHTQSQSHSHSIPFRYISVIAMTVGHINFSAQTLENLFKQQISRCECRDDTQANK